MLKPSTLSGFMELLPAPQIAFNKMLDSVRAVFESFGAVPLDTPVMERAEILLAKAGGETEKQIYAFEKGDTKLALRFDLTVPLAKYVALHAGQLRFPFKRYHIGKVYRGERAQKGRFREFYQCDIDVVGVDTLSLGYDAEIVAVACKAVAALGLGDFVVNISNRKIVSGLLEMAEISDAARPEVMHALDKMPKVGLDETRSWLGEIGLNPRQIAMLAETMARRGAGPAVLDELARLPGQTALFRTGVEELTRVVGLAGSMGVPAANLAVNLGIVRGLDYYTGTVYETFATAAPEFGSIMSGGRYDDLAGFYTTQKLPGVGISLGLTRLFDLMTNAGLVKADAATSARLTVIPMDPADPRICAAAAALSGQVRQAGIAVDVLWDEGKSFKSRLGSAAKTGVPFVAIIGADEAGDGTASVKNMATGEQARVPLSAVRGAIA
ncbi:histidine--tRNA ligase [Alphaproteobacteria bacterium]|nr:histidine--tRNA ligase [Alphaproteobacteria bacterium]